MRTSLISIGAALGLAFNAFATGSLGVNPPQSGVLNFSAATGLVQTNQFAFPYQTTPLVIVNGLLTNNNPFTVSGITTTNFILTVTTGATTNASVAWQSFVGGTKLQFGTFVPGSGGATTYTNTFASAYALPPSVVVSGSLLPNATNNVVVVSTVTTTNFIVSTGNTNQTIYWQAVGTVYNPQSEYTGQNPVNNKVLTQ